MRIIKDEIAERLKSGNHLDQLEFYRLYRGIILKVCMRFTNNDYQEACDLLNSMLMRIFNKIDQYKGIGSFDGWVKRIIYNMGRDYIKRKKALKAEPNRVLNWSDTYIEDNCNEPINYLYESNEALHPDITLDDIMTGVEVLPERQREVFKLYNIEGYTHAQIAKAMCIHIGTSKSQLYRAKLTLAKFLKEKHGIVNFK